MVSVSSIQLKDYQIRLATILAETGALFFKSNLKLKDGRPTPYFVNLGAFNSGKLNSELGQFFASMLIHNDLIDKIDVIVGPSYKGSALACTTANALWKEHQIDLKFDYDRREFKTHGEASLRASYFVNNSLQDECRIFIVDDVGTSMATKIELIDKIKAEESRKEGQFKIVGIGLGVDRQQTTAVYREGNLIESESGINAIAEFTRQTGIPVYHLLSIQDLICYIYEHKIPVKGGTEEAQESDQFTPISEETFQECKSYWKKYGVES